MLLSRATVAGLIAVSFLGACGGGGGPGPAPLNITQEHLASPVDSASKYLLYLPNDYGVDTARQWPLIIFLHGSQPFSNLTLAGLSTQGVMGHMKTSGERLQAIVVQPQQDVNATGHKIDWHDPVFVDAVIHEVEARYSVDRTRVSITGGSLGGFGSWNMALAYPNRFAAVMPVVGGLSNDTDSYDRQLPITNAQDWGTAFQRLQTVMFRVYAGTYDSQVPIAWARNPVNMLAAVNGNLLDYRENSVSHVGNHDVAFTTEPIGWMLAQSRPDATEDTSPMAGADYVGSYHMVGGSAVAATLVNGNLMLTFGDGRRPMPFLYIGDDRFMASWMMRALRDSQGHVKCLVTPLALLPAVLKDDATEACI